MWHDMGEIRISAWTVPFECHAVMSVDNQNLTFWGTQGQWRPINPWRWGHYIPLKYQEPITQWHSPYPIWNKMFLESRLFIFRLLYLNISVNAIFDLLTKGTLTYWGCCLSSYFFCYSYISCNSYLYYA
jgi:hypothetical protein